MLAKRIFEYYLGICLLFFCFLPKSIAIATVGLLGFTIYFIVRKQVRFRSTKVHLFFVLLYLFYVFGLLYSSHLDIGLKYLEYKMLFFLLPLFLSFRFEDGFDIKGLYLGLIIGVIIASVLGLIHSSGIYRQTHDFNNAFGSGNFSYIHHPTYFSTFLLVSLVMFYEGYKKSWRFFNKLTLCIFFFFTALMTFFCFSFAGLILFLSLMLFWLFLFLYKKLSKRVFYFSLLSIPLILIAVYASNVHIRIIVDGVGSSLNGFIKDPKSKLRIPDIETPGNETRLIMWVVSTEEIMKHPFGVGTGDVDEALGNRLKAYNLNVLAKKAYNPHNQFLQTWLEVGLQGFLVLVGLILIVLTFAWKHKNAILLVLAGSLFFNSLFESMLQRESGIVFYTFLILVIVSSNSINFSPSKK